MWWPDRFSDMGQVNKWPNEGTQKRRQYPRAPIMQEAGENYALNKLLMMSQWCLVKRHCFPSDPFVFVPFSPFNERHKKRPSSSTTFSFSFIPFPFFLLPFVSPLQLTCVFASVFPILSRSLPLRGPDLVPENMLEWACSAGKGLLMQTPLGFIHWTSRIYRRCDSFHLTVNFSN